MHANLMRASGTRKQTQQRDVVATLDDFEGGHGFSAAAPNRHAGAVDRVAANGLSDRSAVAADPTPYPGQVPFIDFSPAKLVAQRRERCGILGDDQHAGGIFIETMHDAGAEGIEAGPRPAPVMQEGAHQRAAPVSRCRVDYHPRGFVDH